MSNKDKLSAMLDAIVGNKPEEAQIAFHDYLGDKMKSEIHGETEIEVEPENNEE